MPSRFEDIPEPTRRLLLALDDKTVESLRELLTEEKLDDVESAVKFFRDIRTFGKFTRRFFVILAAILSLFAGASTVLTWMSKITVKFGAVE